VPEMNFMSILFNSFPEAMIVAWLGMSLLGLRPGFYRIVLIGCLQALFDSFIFLYVGRLISIPFGVHTVVEALFFSGIIYGVMRISYKSSLLAALLGIGIYLCIESVITPLFSLMTGYTAIIAFDNWRVRMTYFVAKCIVVIMLIIIIRRFDIRLLDKWETVRNNKFLWVAGLLFSQGLFIAFLYWKYFLQYSELFPLVYIYFYFSVANIILPIISIIVIRQFVILMKSEIESKIQLDALRQVEELLHTMREQRHNFGHELQVVYGLLEVQEFQAAQDYLKKSVTEVAAASESVKTDNLGITALLYTKTGLAEARNIDLHITVETSLRQLSMETRDINLILGNLIDNAVEAVEGLTAPERRVEVTIKQNLEGYVFAVANGGATISPDTIDQIFKPGFSTKGEGRGMGLYSIKKLVKKYHGDIRVTSDSDGTCFRVVIPVGQSGRQRTLVNCFEERWQNGWVKRICNRCSALLRRGVAS